MPPKFRVIVFGKPDCKKCELLQGRLDELLAKPEWQQFEKRYCNLETEDGLVAFCKAECVNPSRVPALMITRLDDASGRYEALPNPRPGKLDPVQGRSRLYTHLGLQTDYSGKGGGVISPKMITSLFAEAMAQA
ncbi:MAG: hypothetical protein BWZ02_02376 [Lentisphaerae bacterium ADurb.BinA184]|nr:MAG: hypothetical protein BWZ02_02376 [Lentisphaerae bacterium ADurb.BinA184]